MSATDDALAANAEYTATGPGTGHAVPGRHLFVLTCMDTRLDPLSMLGLELGDAHIMRNAGARVTEDVLRSLLLSQRTLGTREVMIIHHTDCGVFVEDQQAVRDRISEAVGHETTVSVELLTFTDEVGAVTADVEAVREWGFSHPDTVVRGFIYDVDSGQLREIE